jgi:hypothetical protein
VEHLGGIEEKNIKNQNFILPLEHFHSLDNNIDETLEQTDSSSGDNDNNLDESFVETIFGI